MTLTARSALATLAGLIAAALVAAPTSAQEKHKFSFTTPPGLSVYTQQHEIEVGDVPGHKLRLYETRSKYTGEAPSYAGIKVVEAWTRAMSDYTDGNGRASGYGVFILENGDKIFSRYDVLTHTVAESDGARKTSVATVATLTGGTGKFSTIRGTLRSVGGVDFARGTTGAKTEGEYWFAK